MVRTVVAACFVLLLAIPALAQEDYPKIQTAMGYANLSFTDFATGNSSRHSGFANQTGFNLTKTWGLENYMGIYGLGQGVTLISDFFGGKATYRASKVAPYALAGIGVGYFTQSTSYGYGAQSSFATRVGAGVDVPFNDTMAIKFEVSRMGFHIQTKPGSGWTNGTNFSTGIVFTLAQ
jgi:hypothetical protein